MLQNGSVHLSLSYDQKPWLGSYDADVSPEVNVPDVSLSDRLEEIFGRYPERPACHFFGNTVSYGSFNALANRFAQALLANGCLPGDVVAINLPNIPQYLVAQVGTLKAGCAASGLSPLLTPSEMAYQLNDCGAKVLVTLDAIFEHRFLGISDQLPHLKLVVATGIADFMPKVKGMLAKLLKKVPTGRMTALPDKRATAFRELLRRHPAERPELKPSPDDHCLIQYTGGTTGLPKGTVLTHRNLVANLTQGCEWIKPEEGRESVLSGFPLFHLAGLMLGLVSLSTGGAQVLIPNPRDTRHIVKELERYRPTMMVNVPSLYMMLMDEPGFRKVDFSNLKFCLSGAAPFPVDAIRALEDVVGANKVLEVYGMTETSPLITMNPHKGKKKLGTVGVPIPSTRVRLVDLETGTEEAAVGEEGEIVVRGPQVMKGYYNKPDETAIAIREFKGERWLYTGDVARMDEDGYFTIVDRSKDMLNVGGYKVFSREVEEKLCDHPAIELCAVVGVPNPKRAGSEWVKLVVQLDRSCRNRKKDELEEEILSFCREKLSPYKVPKTIVFMDQLPLTPVGKVDKKALR